MLHLYVYNPDDGYDHALPASALRPAEYLRAAPPWRPELGECLLVLDTTPDPLLEINPFGWLHELSAQLDEAARRLEAGQRALIRSCGDWTPTFLALEPAGRVTLLSVLMPLPTEIESYLPSRSASPGGVDQRTVLYDYVESHRDALRPGHETSPMVSRAKRQLQDVPLSSDNLPTALHAEARDGLALYKMLTLATKTT